MERFFESFALDTVRDAVERTIATQITHARYVRSPKSLGEAAVQATAGKCQHATLFTLWLLATPDFDRHMLLSAWEQDTPRDRKLLNHAYFLVRDTRSIWYAGSPANFTLIGNPETYQVYSGSLEQVVKQFRAYPTASCRWPKVGDIARSAELTKDVIPTIQEGATNETGVITVFEMQSIVSRTAGLRYECDRVPLKYNFRSVLPAWGGIE